MLGLRDYRWQRSTIGVLHPMINLEGRFNLIPHRGGENISRLGNDTLQRRRKLHRLRGKAEKKGRPCNTGGRVLPGRADCPASLVIASKLAPPDEEKRKPQLLLEWFWYEQGQN
ncbi:hypothetical protein JZ751_011165 [Albula glossodonta]|uniref:Uncharacterized protein n=1 Tax=Albula glossodonta TaxID=121402 RepID=A0A8T2NVX0_9TELE|nr:hypothetical protein JZ751_011165 [Albula glossodonta]